MKKVFTDKNNSTIQKRDFFCSTVEPNRKDIGPIYTKNYISHFKPIGYSNQCLIFICLKDSKNDVIKSFIISGRMLDIKKRVYYTMKILESKGEIKC